MGKDEGAESSTHREGLASAEVITEPGKKAEYLSAEMVSEVSCGGGGCNYKNALIFSRKKEVRPFLRVTMRRY